MQDWQQVVGFSDLKDLLIRTHKIPKQKDEMKIFFTSSQGHIWVHDTQEPEIKVAICSLGAEPKIPRGVSARAVLLLQYAMTTKSPVEFLNQGFETYGFFQR